MKICLIFKALMQSLMWLLYDKCGDMEVFTYPHDFTPIHEQTDTLARRLIPVIKRFLADEQVQREFAEWKQQQNTDK